MAGYMTKMVGNIYEGEFTNGADEAVENGVLLVPGTSGNAGKLVKPTADADSKFLLKEITTLYDGIEAYRFVPTKLATVYYFVENGFEVDESVEYDTTKYTTPVGGMLRAHPIQVGEELVTTKITGSLTVGTEYGVKADGTIG